MLTNVCVSEDGGPSPAAPALVVRREGASPALLVEHFTPPDCTLTRCDAWSTLG